jgi:hypothetical protein
VPLSAVFYFLGVNINLSGGQYGPRNHDLGFLGLLIRLVKDYFRGVIYGPRY